MEFYLFYKGLAGLNRVSRQKEHKPKNKMDSIPSLFNLQSSIFNLL